MTRYILRRVIAILPTLFLITIFGFLVMEAPAGDYVTSYIVREYGHGNTEAARIEDELRSFFALDRPVYERFVTWLGRFAQGDFGDSFDLRRPVRDILNDRIGLTSPSPWRPSPFPGASASRSASTAPPINTPKPTTS